MSFCLLSAFLLVRLHVQLLLFFVQSVVCVQVERLIGATQGSCRVAGCLLEDSLVLLDLFTVACEKHLLALLGTFGGSKNLVNRLIGRLLLLFFFRLLLNDRSWTWFGNWLRRCYTWFDNRSRCRFDGLGRVFICALVPALFDIP